MLDKIIGKRVLIVGDVGTGKTLLTSRILKSLLNLGYGNDITVIDMAPRRRGRIGGLIEDYIKNMGEIRYLKPPIVYAPRISARNREELIWMVNENAKNINILLNIFISNPTDILVINDLTLYFHAGDFNKICSCINVSKTFIANAYYGKSITYDYETGVTLREKEFTERLIRKMDIVINLNKERLSIVEEIFR